MAVLNVPLRELSLGYSLKTTILVDEYVMGTVSSRAEWKAIPESPWMLEDESVGNKCHGSLYLR